MLLYTFRFVHSVLPESQKQTLLPNWFVEPRKHNIQSNTSTKVVCGAKKTPNSINYCYQSGLWSQESTKINHCYRFGKFWNLMKSRELPPLRWFLYNLTWVQWVSGSVCLTATSYQRLISPVCFEPESLEGGKRNPKWSNRVLKAGPGILRREDFRRSRGWRGGWKDKVKKRAPLLGQCHVTSFLWVVHVELSDILWSDVSSRLSWFWWRWIQSMMIFHML